MTNSTRCTLLAKQACTTLSHVVQKITPPSANNFLKLFSALFAMLALGVGNAWGATYTKVTSAPADWSGEYIVVYESNNTAYVWTGVDAAKCNTTATISSNSVTGDFVTVTIAPMTGGYSIKVNSGTNSGKYIYGTSGSNKLNFNASAQLNTLSYETDWVKITSNTSVLTFNKASSDMRFRYYKAASYSAQQHIQLYKLSTGGSVTPDPITVTLDKSTLSLEEGENATLTATVTGSTDAVTWTSDASNIASVDNAGKVTAVAAGEATITAAIGDVKATCDVTVTAATTPEEPGTGGESGSYTWDLSKKTYTTGTNEVTWTCSIATMHNTGTNATNYLGGDANNRTSSRFYTGNTLTITPASNISISSVVFTAASSNYASILKNSTWTNASASVSGTTVTVTPTTKTSAISTTISGTCGFTGVTVNYTQTGSGTEEPVPSLTTDQFSWSATTATATLPNTFDNPPTLTNKESLAVSYSSSNGEVATIDANGNVTLVGKGETIISATAGDDETYKKTTVSYTLTVKPAPLAPIAGGVIDILNQDWTDVTGTNYTEVAAKTAENEGHSNAQYVAQCAGDKSSIQLRSNNNNSGVVSTISGGIVKRVEVEWQNETAAGRILQVYGSNTAYEAATDLYSDDKKGELLGEITMGGDETVVDYSQWTGDYKYIGLRSKSGAMYLTTITITWLPINSKVTIDDAIQHGSVSVTGATDLNAVAAGTELTLSNTPATNYKLAAYNVYKTGEESTEVTVADDNTFIMPEFDVTISATFVPAKTLTDIEITNAATQTTFWQTETFNHNGLKVTAHFDGADDEDVTDKVTVTGSTATAGAAVEVTVSYNEGATTKTATYNITVKAIPNTKETAYTVADAFDIIDKLGDTDKMYITGFVSQADLVQSTIDQYKNADYWISVDGTTNGQQLEAYRGKYLDNADFTSVNQIMVGDEVIIYGKLTKYNSTYEFAAGNYLVSLKRDKQQPELSYTTTEYNVNLGEAFTAPTLNNPHTLAVTYSSNNEDVATVATDGVVTIKAAGTVTITASFAGDENYVAGEASYTITITDPALAIATLPFEFNGGLNDIVSTAGITQEGLGSDYTSNNAQNSKLKFDHTGDYIIIHFDTKPNKLMYNIKNNSCSGGTFLVQESTDGETYSTICTYQDEFDDKPDALHTLQATSRYVKFIYTEKSSGNVGLGNIKITKLDTRKEAGLAWSTTSYNTYDGDETLAPTLTNPYGLNITYSSSNEDVATIDEAGKLTLKNTGTTTITATFAGNENYKEAEVSYTLSYASKWALTYTSNVEVGNNAVEINNTEYEAIKTGTSTVHGSTKVKVPISTHTLHFHAAGWGKDEDVKLIVKNGETELGTFVLSKDAGVKNSSPFILEGTPYLQYYSVALTNITEEATITFEASTTGGERFVLYGVNQEGGVLPELDRIEIVGEAIELEYEIGDEFNPIGLSVNAIYTLAGVEHETVAVDTEDVEWSFDPATIAAETSQVEVTATYEGKTATKTVTGLTVIIPEPEILVTPQTVSFNASQNQSIDTKTISITLKNVTSATVSLTGDGASAFNIDKTQFTESGSLIITPNTSKVGTFKAAITIADDAGVAESKKVTLTLNVTTTDNLNGTWSLITDASNLKANIKVIIASAADSEIIYTMGAQNTNNRAAIQSSVVGNTLKPELGTKVFTLVNAGDGKFAIKAINGNYLYAASNSANQLKEKDEIDVNGLWTITIADNKATIKAEGSSNRNWIRFNPNNGTPLFSCYASGQEDIYLYTTHVTVNETTDNTSIPNQSDVTVDNAELTVTTEAEYDNMYIGGNGTVKVVNEVTVNNLYISTTMGATTSGQLSTTPENLNVTGDAFIDITLGKNGEDKIGDPNQWHAFTVPFPVDAMNGVYDINDNKLTNEVNYAIMDYHGDLRANGQYGWKKYRGILVPGTFYLMTVDGKRTTYRFKKVEDAAIVAPAKKELKAYNTGTGDDKDKGWNGVGNPTLMHGKVGYKALILNPASYTYEAYEAEEVTFTVGTPFFIQAEPNDDEVTIASETNGSLAPARRAAAAVDKVKVMLGNSDYTDRLYVSASEDAINEYQIGKDLGKMAMTNTPRVVQISALAYDTRLCMIDAPMANNEALVALNLYAPANGEYTLSIEAQDNEKVYLLHEGTFVWDLSMSEYPITLNKGDNTGYSILVRRADAPTSVETIDGANNQSEKLIHNGNLYILHNGKVFDAVGTMLK